MWSDFKSSWWMKQKLLAIAFASAFIALALSAANQLRGASWAFMTTCIALLLAAIAHTYSQLSDAKQKDIASRRNIRNVALVSFVLATIVSCTFWFGGWKLHIPVPPRYLVKLDFVPAAFSLALPFSWRSGLHFYFRHVTYCFPGPFWWESMRYLRTAIPAYFISCFVFMMLAQLIFFRLRFKAGS